MAWRDADLYMAQQMPLPLTVSCFSKLQIGFTFLVLAHPGSPGQRAVKRVCTTISSKTSMDLNEAREDSVLGCMALAGPYANNLHVAPGR